MEDTHVCVMGLGYIGLPTAALLANSGFTVHGVDVLPSVVNTINEGKVHIVEPDLDAFVNAAVHSGKLKAGLEPEPADVFIIAVPTPFMDGNVPNTEYIVEATKAISKVIQSGNLVILESTSPVGTTELMNETLQEMGHDTTDIYLAHCPERVLPGKVMQELIENDRVVGGMTDKSTHAVASFYKRFVKGEVLETNARMAEMCKLTENSSRDVNIAFANELSLICDELDLDVWELIRLANKHPRVNILQPGPGVGGHCIAVDPWFIVHRNPNSSKLIRQAREINDYKPHYVMGRVEQALESCGKKDPVVGCLGLSFKANIDDLRESPALYITKQLHIDHQVIACEPNLEGEINEFNEHLVAGLTLKSLEDTIKESDVLVLLVDHKEFYELAPSQLQGKTLIDTKGVVGRKS